MDILKNKSKKKKNRPAEDSSHISEIKAEKIPTGGGQQEVAADGAWAWRAHYKCGPGFNNVHGADIVVRCCGEWHLQLGSETVWG